MINTVSMTCTRCGLERSFGVSRTRADGTSEIAVPLCPCTAAETGRVAFKRGDRVRVCSVPVTEKRYAEMVGTLVTFKALISPTWAAVVLDGDPDVDSSWFQLPLVHLEPADT